jgi:hypothetical protein
VSTFIAYLLLGVAAGIIASVIWKLLSHERKFNNYVAELRGMTEAMKQSNREVSELHFRDITGRPRIVRIVVDYGLTDEVLSDGLIDFVRSTKVANNTDEMIFSPRAVRELRAKGLEPDDVVRQMLIASGIMPR